MSFNSPDLWLPHFPRPSQDGHKYDRGHALIYGGPEKTGAARLAASACARMGAGLTTIAAPPGKADLYRMEIESHLMVSEESFLSLAENDKVTALCIGPGAGLTNPQIVLESLALRKPIVLDADAISVFKYDPPALFNALHDQAVLTPHQGEFERVFGTMTVSDAVKATGCTVLLKGAHTHIAAPNWQVVINQADAPYLATAGTGDVLAGMITGLLAQGMDTHPAACAAVWIHAEMGRELGAGLVASDLPAYIPVILKRLGL